MLLTIWVVRSANVALVTLLLRPLLSALAVRVELGNGTQYFAIAEPFCKGFFNQQMAGAKVRRKLNLNVMDLFLRPFQKRFIKTYFAFHTKL